MIILSFLKKAQNVINRTKLKRPYFSMIFGFKCIPKNLNKVAHSLVNWSFYSNNESFFHRFSLTQ